MTLPQQDQPLGIYEDAHENLVLCRASAGDRLRRIDVASEGGMPACGTDDNRQADRASEHSGQQAVGQAVGFGLPVETVASTPTAFESRDIP